MLLIQPFVSAVAYCIRRFLFDSSILGKVTSNYRRFPNSFDARKTAD